MHHQVLIPVDPPRAIRVGHLPDELERPGHVGMCKKPRPLA